MKYPNLNEEKRLWKKGYNIVVGIDEAGRGPLAGPVVAAAFCFKANREIYRGPSSVDFYWKIYRGRASVDFPEAWSLEIKDSKKLNAKQREEFYKILTNHPSVGWGIGRVSEKVIDKINILQATKLAMRKAVVDLEKKLHPLQKTHDRRFFATSGFLLIDGNFTLPVKSLAKAGINCPQKAIIKGDQKVFSIAAASIIAKVTRDKIMLRYHKKYPYYCFDKNKGYPTILHRQKIKKYGFCKIHRRSFKMN